MEPRWWLYYNPWEHRVPTESLTTIVKKVAARRSEHVEMMFESGAYKRDSLGVVILDPSAPLMTPSLETLLMAIAIGPNGEDYVANALAKAVYHRDHRRPSGYGTYLDSAVSRDGDFTWGLSATVDGAFAGASGQHPLQDAMEAAHTLTSFLYYVRMEQTVWLESHEEQPRWFCDQNQPGVGYVQALNRDPLRAGDGPMKWARQQ